jgi:DNA-binding NarL/FixJ family response regulator
MHHIPTKEKSQQEQLANDLEISFSSIVATSSSEEPHPHMLSDRHPDRQRQPIRVLLVDDHALMREGLRQLFERVEDIEVVGEAIDGLEVKTKVRQLHPDVVLMDIHMPVINGIAITGQISQEFPEIAVIMLSMYHQDQQVLQAMRNGAKGYLLKSASIHEVAQAIRTVHSGGIAIEPDMAGTVVNEFRRLSESLTNQGAEALAEKEIEIIRYVAHGLSNREIAEKLAYSEKTVKNYLSIIFQKLHLRDRTQVAIFALRHGLLPNDE